MCLTQESDSSFICEVVVLLFDTSHRNGELQRHSSFLCCLIRVILRDQESKFPQKNRPGCKNAEDYKGMLVADAVCEGFFPSPKLGKEAFKVD